MRGHAGQGRSVTGPLWDDKIESLDDLILGGLKIIQARRGYRFSLDAVLLAHFPDLRHTDTVIDLGTGSGIIPLLLAYRKPGLRITGIELQKGMAERARRSIRMNGMEGQITVECRDIRMIPASSPTGQAELITCNPPFWKEEEGLLNRNPEAAVARHEIELRLMDIVKAAAHLLRPGGRLAMIHRAARRQEIEESFESGGFTFTRLRRVQSFAGEEAKLLLVEGALKAGTHAPEDPPLVVYQSPGRYSGEIGAIYAADLKSGGNRESEDANGKALHLRHPDREP